MTVDLETMCDGVLTIQRKYTIQWHTSQYLRIKIAYGLYIVPTIDFGILKMCIVTYG